MYINGAKVAAAISLMYVLHTLSTAIEATFTGIPFSVVWFALRQPQPLATTIVCLLLGFGLWRQYRWAWWLGISAAVVQLGRIIELWAISPSVATDNLISQAFVISFLVIIALPSTRRLCVRVFQIRV